MTYKEGRNDREKTGMAPVKQGFMGQEEKKEGMIYKPLFVRKIDF